jgi:hypothetical protein
MNYAPIVLYRCHLFVVVVRYSQVMKMTSLFYVCNFINLDVQ